MEKHEDNCWHRLIPCVWCDVEIRMKRLKEHQEKHGREPLPYNGLSTVTGFSIGKDIKKSQAVRQ